MDNFGSPPPPSPQLSVADESETQESQPLPSPAGVQTSGNEMHDECEQKIYSRPYMLVKKCVFYVIWRDYCKKIILCFPGRVWSLIRVLIISQCQHFAATLL